MVLPTKNQDFTIISSFIIIITIIIIIIIIIVLIIIIIIIIIIIVIIITSKGALGHRLPDYTNCSGLKLKWVYYHLSYISKQHHLIIFKYIILKYFKITFLLHFTPLDISFSLFVT